MLSGGIDARQKERYTKIEKEREMTIKRGRIRNNREGVLIPEGHEC